MAEFRPMMADVGILLFDDAFFWYNQIKMKNLIKA